MRTTQTLLAKLFTGATSPRWNLKSSNAAIVCQSAQSAHSAVLEKRSKPALFQRNGGSIGIAALIVVASGVLAAGASAGGGGILVVIGVLGLMVATLVVFGVLVKAPSPAGRKLLDEIEGLKLYLCASPNATNWRSMPGPDAPPVLDAKRYEVLLALCGGAGSGGRLDDRSSPWPWAPRRRRQQRPRSPGTRAASIGDLGSFSKAVGSSLSSQIASSSSPPGSSSGGGGGGSSGGGGGGGGGGGR